MIHTSVFQMRCNKLKEALAAIDRALSISQELNNQQEVHEAYIELYTIKAKTLAKLRRYDESLACLRKAQYNREKVF